MSFSAGSASSSNRWQQSRGTNPRQQYRQVKERLGLVIPGRLFGNRYLSGTGPEVRAAINKIDDPKLLRKLSADLNQVSNLETDIGVKAAALNKLIQTRLAVLTAAAHPP